MPNRCCCLRTVTLATSEETGHGRIEKRQVCATYDLLWLPQREDWQLQTLVEIRTEQVIGSEIKTSTRYYGSSRKAKAALVDRKPTLCNGCHIQRGC